MKIFLFLSVLLTFAAATVLLHVKHNVVELELQIDRLSGTLRETKEETASLEGQLLALTGPQRIEQLQKQHMPHLQRLRRDQRVNPAALTPPKEGIGPR